MADETKPFTKVLGRLVYLDDKRLVFLGESEEAPGVHFIGFRNGESEDLRFNLSHEAFAALATLIQNPMFGMPLVGFPYKHQWTLVKPEHDQT